MPSAAPCAFTSTTSLRQQDQRQAVQEYDTILPFTIVELYLHTSACKQTNQYKHTFCQKKKVQENQPSLITFTSPT